jgi:hypothetical protein
MVEEKMKAVVTFLLAGGAITFAAAAALAQGAPEGAPVERREVAEHVHGEAMMRIAIEGNQMSIDFDAPGVDVVGFEHIPGSPEERAAVDAAVAALENPLPTLFDFGAAAGCSITSAEVEFLVEEEEPAPAPAPAPGAAPGAPEEITNHTGFEGVYGIACTNAGAIRELRFGFFEKFPNAEVVEVELATGRGQTTVDVERANPVLSFAGLI